MYQEVDKNVKPCREVIEDIPRTIGLHQDPNLSLFLSARDLDEIAQSIQDVPWCILFVDDTREG